ncbi:hypothetical protein CVS40_6868 [Lucilia cuprina]|nr:hypothetical protein CVS40_6868 [Lucilia cuprina]
MKATNPQQCLLYKLKGTARNIIGNEATIAEIVSKLNSTVKGESVEVLSAKIMNIRKTSRKV